jgi:hypothetical protein
MITGIYENTRFAGNLNNVASNATGSLNIPQRMLASRCMLEFQTSAGVAVAHTAIVSEVNQIRFLVGSQEIYRATPDAINDLNAHYLTRTNGTFSDKGIVTLWFSDLALLAVGDFMSAWSTALGTAGVPSLSVEVGFGTLSTIAIVKVHMIGSSINKPFESGVHNRFEQFSETVASTGDAEKTDWAINAGNVGLKNIMIEVPGASVVGDAQLQITAADVYDIYPQDTSLDIHEQLWADAGRAAIDDRFFFVLDAAQNTEAFLPMQGIQQIRTVINWVTAAPTTHNVHMYRAFNLASGNNNA